MHEAEHVPSRSMPQCLVHWYFHADPLSIRMLCAWGAPASLSWRSTVGTTVGIVSESLPGERRVAMTPGALSVLKKTNVELLMETGAGIAAGMPDAEYVEKGVRLAGREE